MVISLGENLSHSETRETLQSLELIERDETRLIAADSNKQDHALKRAIIGEIIVGLYAEALDVYLAEAGEVEAEAEWWADVERSRGNVACYYLQSKSYYLSSLFRQLLYSAP